MRVAVVGAGLTGLTCARALTAEGVAVVVFEKARGAGGRLSSRRTDAGGFDHGASILHRDEVGPVDGVSLQPWPDADHLVPVPTASALPKALAEGVELRATAHVAPLPADGPLRLAALDGTDLGTFDRVVVTAPAPQVATLLADRAPQVAARAAATTMAPCWAALVALDAPVSDLDDIIRDRGPIARAIRESSKPGRVSGERWTIQATAEFSRDHLEADPQEVAAALLEALGVPSPPLLVQAHRWRYARVDEAVPEPLLRDDGAGVLAGGDWCTPAEPDGPAPGTVAAAQAAGVALARELRAS